MHVCSDLFTLFPLISGTAFKYPLTGGGVGGGCGGGGVPDSHFCLFRAETAAGVGRGQTGLESSCRLGLLLFAVVLKGQFAWF